VTAFIVGRMAAVKPFPLLFISDAVTARTGLARITCDLASRVHKHLGHLYRVGTLGYGGIYDCRLGFPQWSDEGQVDFILPQLPEVWSNLAGDEKGAVLCVWDVSRLAWLSNPRGSQLLLDQKYKSLVNWIEKAPFKKWLYCPVDASGPNDRMSFPLMKSLLGFDRIVGYTRWGADVILRTIGEENAIARKLDWVPHGIDGKIFSPSLDRKMARSVFPTLTEATSIVAPTRFIKPDELLIGIVATNQSRKDFALGIEAAAIVGQSKKVRLWIHTDTYTRDWDIIALLADHQLLGEKTLISTGYLPDEQMAEAYSGCDVTIGIGPEGFGYPIAESVFCGTPCVHGNYGGGPQILKAWPEFLVEPREFKIEGKFSQRRPVYRAEDFAAAILAVAGMRTSPPAFLEWDNLWPHWQTWFENAAADLG
jgi:glycosyltransferase involved in cell wall biosynthesis